MGGDCHGDGGGLIRYMEMGDMAVRDNGARRGEMASEAEMIKRLAGGQKESQTWSWSGKWQWLLAAGRVSVGGSRGAVR